MITNILLTLPFWILGVGGVLIMIADSFMAQRWPRAMATGSIVIAAIASLLATRGWYQPGLTVFNGVVAADPYAFFTTMLMLLSTLLVIFMGYNQTEKEGVESPGEFYALLLMSLAGGLLFVNAAELIAMFLGLEIMSMALYCLCGASISRRESSEAALKYFLLGSFSSAFLLYGIALLYGLTGSTFLGQVASGVSSIDSPVLAIAIGLCIVGLAFKIAIVPFHFWAPDVYQGAPTSITAFMACVVKASAVGAMLRVVWTVFPAHLPLWSGLIWVLSLLTIIVGNLVALRQRNVKRMLAYSSIAHAGYMTAALLVPSAQFGGGSAILFYLVTYTAMTLGAFAVLMALDAPADTDHPYDIGAFHGLAKSRPLLSAVMALFMLTLAGLPPGIAGLLGKFYVFSAAVKGGYVGLAIVGMIGSTVSCYYYLRVIVAMYFLEPVYNRETQSHQSLLLRGAITACAAGCIIFGMFPDGLYSAAQSVMQSLLR